jgi:hypothetical protein
VENYNHVRKQALLLWKVYEPPEELSLLDETFNTLENASICFEPRDGDETNEEEVRRVIADEKKRQLDNNEIMSVYRRFRMGSEKPMTRINIFKFFEELMDKKFETDRGDIEAGRMPRTMTEFMLEHVNR